MVVLIAYGAMTGGCSRGGDWDATGGHVLPGCGHDTLALTIYQVLHWEKAALELPLSLVGLFEVWHALVEAL